MAVVVARAILDHIGSYQDDINRRNKSLSNINEYHYYQYKFILKQYVSIASVDTQLLLWSRQSSHCLESNPSQCY